MPKRKHAPLIMAAAVAVATAPTAAVAATAVKVEESGEHGQHLTDGDGRAVYLFTADTQGAGDAKAQIACSGACLDAWPLVRADGELKAGDMVDPAMLGTMQHDGQEVVTYNGWPLYYFAKDEGAGEATGQDIHSFGGEWYLVAPAGRKVEEE